MQYTIKTASILLKNKTHAILDDNGDIKTLRKVLKKAFPNGIYQDDLIGKYKYYAGSISWIGFDSSYPESCQLINLSEITKKPKMKPETFTISKADYDRFKALESDDRRLSRDEFALGAMQGLCATIDTTQSQLTNNQIAVISYRIADAMIKQRDL